MSANLRKYEGLSRRVRDALGKENDDDVPVTVLVAKLATEAAWLREANSRLIRGEYICTKCGLRQQSTNPDHPGF
jgi:tRNA U54 and U55 pseudouridine synthase Pus10